jgi:hypothetical protein
LLIFLIGPTTIYQSSQPLSFALHGHYIFHMDRESGGENEYKLKFPTKISITILHIWRFLSRFLNKRHKTVWVHPTSIVFIFSKICLNRVFWKCPKYQMKINILFKKYPNVEKKFWIVPWKKLRFAVIFKRALTILFPRNLSQV